LRGIRLPQRRGWLVGWSWAGAAVRMCAVGLCDRDRDTPARVANFDPPSPRLRRDRSASA